DRKDARARTDIQYPHARLDELLHCGKAQPCRRMQPGAERHAWIEQQHHVTRSPHVVRLAPARDDDRPLPDAVDEEILLPRVGPVLLAQRAHLEWADVAQLAKGPDRDLQDRLA